MKNNKSKEFYKAISSLRNSNKNMDYTFITELKENEEIIKDQNIIN